MYFECRESQELRDEILAKTLDIFWVQGRKRSRMDVLLTLNKENGILQPTKWYSD